MRTKAYRRAKHASKLNKRIEMYAAIRWMGTDTRQEFRQNVLNGTYCRWLRYTARPCSCCLCQKLYKYKRIKKCDIAKLVKAQDS